MQEMKLQMEAFKLGSSGAPSTWSKLRSRSVLDPEHGIYLDQSGKIGSRSCLCLEKGADLNQDPPLDDPGPSFDLEQSSIWSGPRSGTWVLDPEHGIYLDQSGKIGSRSCLCLEKGADLNQDPPLDDPGRSFDLDQSSIWNMAFVWIMLHMEGVLSG